MLQQSSEPQKPAVWKWFVAYCVAMALLYLLTAAIGFCLLLIDPAGSGMDTLEAKVMGVLLSGLGLGMLIPYAAGPFLPQRRWAWVVGLTLICIGMTSACCLPAAVPLLIWWIKPATKEYYNEVRGE